MSKERILLNGSSWTEGAYIKGDSPVSDILVPGGLPDLLAERYNVVNISTGGDYHMASILRMRNYLKDYKKFDRIIFCQNDPLRDILVLTTNQSKVYNFYTQHIVEFQLRSINKLIKYFLDRLYKELSMMYNIPVYLIGGCSCVDVELAKHYGLNVISPSWVKDLVPGYSAGYVEDSPALYQAHQVLMGIFLTEVSSLKEEFIHYSDEIGRLLNLYKDNPDLFANHHPTALGNKLFYEKRFK